RGPVGLRSRELFDETVEIERQRCHLEPAVGVAPLGARAVAVDLDPVALGIVQVERLAYEVIGGAGETPARTGHTPQRASQLEAARDEDREVVEAGARLRPRGRTGVAH